MFGIGQTELLVIGFVVLILFGHRLPAVMFDMGRAITRFKQGVYADSGDDTTASMTKPQA